MGRLPQQVHLQTQQEVKLRMVGMALQVVRSDGVLALYNGLSASLCRQVPGLPTPQGTPPTGPSGSWPHSPRSEQPKGPKGQLVPPQAWTQT